jgi:hypothetical protein
MARTGLLAVSGLLLFACADGTMRLPAAQPLVYPPAGFTHRVGTAHVELYWNCGRPAPGRLRLDGVAYNAWVSQEIRFLEFTLVGVDQQERSVAEAKGEAKDFLLRMNQQTPFTIDLPTTGAEKRFDLYYSYRFHEGDSRFLAGSPVRSGLLAQTKHNVARNICSETQHRILKPGQ